MRSIPTTLVCSLVLSLTLVAAGSSGLLRADDLGNDEVVFTGTVSSVAEDGMGGGTLFIRLQDFNLRVVVNPVTEIIDDASEEISMSDLAEGDFVEIRGKFSSSGILASQIRQLEPVATDFQIRGHITAIPSVGEDGMVISLLGISLQVTDGTTIEQDGAEVGPSVLTIGTHLWAEGTIDDGVWTATLIRLQQGNRKEKVVFEGVIEAITIEGITVAVDGTDGDTTPVLITSKTRIEGELVEGAHVLVKGTFNPDLSVTAREIVVLQALEIKPERRKMAVGETVEFMVKLRETPSEDVDVTLVSSDESVATVSPASIVVTAGSKTAVFDVKGQGIGTATITATALGQTATAEVIVGQLSEEDEVPREMSISFAPSHIRMLTNDTREVVLLIKPPRQGDAPPDVVFESTSGTVTALKSRDLGNGAASMKVVIQTVEAESDSYSIIASLPAYPDVEPAELVVEVGEKKK